MAAPVRVLRPGHPLHHQLDRLVPGAFRLAADLMQKA